MTHALRPGCNQVSCRIEAGPAKGDTSWSAVVKVAFESESESTEYVDDGVGSQVASDWTGSAVRLAERYPLSPTPKVIGRWLCVRASSK